MKKILMWIWQAPQNICGLVYRIGKRRAYGKYYVAKQAVCLGDYVFIRDSDDIAHEDGHRIQSHMLGPLYLPVIGIPSFFLWLWDVVFYWKRQTPEWRYKWYHSKWPENWADRLGGK